MRTTLAIDDALLKEVKALSGAKTKKDAVRVALTEYATDVPPVEKQNPRRADELGHFIGYM